MRLTHAWVKFYGLHEDSVLDVTIDTPDDTPPVCVIHGSEINIDGEMVDVFVSKAGLEAEKYRIESVIRTLTTARRA